MNSDKFISIKTFCKIHGVAESFVYELGEFDVLKLHIKDKEAQLSVEELVVLERMVRLNKELDINTEGLHAVHHLLQKLSKLQEELFVLKRKLGNNV